MRWPWQKPKESYVCRVCGKTHVGAPLALGHALPDVIWEMGEEVRRQHLEWSTDLATFDGRWYLRGVLTVPFAFQPGGFDFGVWAEVEEATIAWFRQNWDRDLSAEPVHSGRLANAIMTYPDTRGLTVEIQFGPSDKRPTFLLIDSGNPAYWEETTQGMGEERYHAILTRTGH